MFGNVQVEPPGYNLHTQCACQGKEHVIYLPESECIYIPEKRHKICFTHVLVITFLDTNSRIVTFCKCQRKLKVQKLILLQFKPFSSEATLKYFHKFYPG